MSAAETHALGAIERIVAIERVVIAGGGTGGHVYPGVAVAEEIQRRNPAATVTFVGTERGMEARILPKLGLPLRTITVSRLKGGGVITRLKGLFRLPVGIWQSWRILRAAKPQVVLGVGGYASGPALIAAWLTRRPTAIQEQNATPGLTNRYLGKVVKAVYLGFDAAASHFKAKKVVHTGNPIRAALVARLAGRPEHADPIPTGSQSSPAKLTALSVLIFGGSQGARFLNENVPGALARFAVAHPTVALRVTHQTGAADEASTRDRYAQSDAGALLSDVRVTPYIDDMPTAYAAADIAICRAGALTVAELTAAGLPCLMVPFPFAADDHQTANAQVLVDAGCAGLMQQTDWSADAVLGWLEGLTPARINHMRRAAQKAARPEAARTIVDHLEGLAR